MSPILGIWASSVTGGLSTNSFESIATANGTGNSGTIEFTNIPSTFTHLQLRMINKGLSAGSFPAGMQLIFNSDTDNANYYNHNLRGNGSTAASSSGASNASYVWSGAGSDGTNVYAAGILDILDYGNTNKYKTGRSLLGADYNGSGMIILGSILWKNTNAITSIKCIADSTYTGNWTTSTQFALYGIKSA